MDEALLKNLREVVEANIDNEQFSVEDLADAVAYSRSHLHRKLSQLTGRSISQYIRGIRLERGMELLKGDVATVSEISYRVGFGSSTYFIKCFNEEYGFSPGEVKKRLSEGWFDNLAEEESVPLVNKFQPGKPAVTPLETLHPSTSESLIKEVFEALVVHKPSLEKYLIVDEEEGEEVDMRLLAYEIIKSYPWPLGVELRRLFSAALKEQGKARYLQLQKTIFRNLKLLAFMLSAELFSLLHKKAIQADRESLSVIAAYFENLEENKLVQFMEELTGILKASYDKVFIKELKEVFDASFFLEMKDWQDLTLQLNEEMTEADFTGINTSLEQTLILLLKKSAFMAGYRMVSVSSIRVKKPLMKSARFEHHLHLLNSSDSDFKIQHELADRFSDSNAVLLLRSIKKADDFLNLSPMMIDTHRDNLNTPDRSNIKRDIYLLENFDGHQLTYNGSDFTGSDDLSGLENYDELLEDFQVILKLMNQ